MSTSCEYCGKIFENEPKFPLEGGGEICEACYISWQEENASVRYDTQIDEKILDILEHKEDYRYEKLDEAIEWLDNYGYSNEANELKRYMRKAKKIEYEEMGNATYGEDSDSVYRGAGATIWISVIKFVCSLYMAVFTALGIWLGAGMLSRKGAAGVLLGGILGACIGIALSALMVVFFMAFATLCENISVMTDNSAQILMKLDKMNGNNRKSKNACDNCGRKIAQDAKFCGFCGEKNRKKMRY